MKYSVYLVLLATGIRGVCSGDSWSERWTVQEQETVEKAAPLSGSPMRLVVDNIDGYVHVTGTSGSQVHVTAHKTIRAETQADLKQARDEVKLDIAGSPGSVSVYYDAPWRCNGESHGCQGDHRRFYAVTYDIDVQVPHSARTVLSTINHGDVLLSGTDGDFDVRDINGGISLTGVSGSGDVSTINGPVSAHFAKNPLRATSFKSINGPLDIYFQRGLSADLEFKTFNGEVYTDFEVSPALAPAADSEVHGGKFVYRSRTAAVGRVGAGGPHVRFDTLNGIIRLHQER